MQGLALADGLTAFCAYGFEPFFNLHYEVIGNDTYSIDDINDTDTEIEELKKLVGLRFPYCLMHYCLTNLGDTFHLVSILLTASLGLQKLLAVACPIWSKIQINERKSCIVCCLCFLFTLTVNVPRLFVISFSRGKERDVCLVSEPQRTIQKYILGYYPIIYAIILVVAAVTMFISTCFILCTICRRKRVRGHVVASRAEKKSCVLIVCVMTFFFLAEVPRLYITSTLFSTYRSNFDMQDVALQKMTTELFLKYSACLDDSLNHISGESCLSDFNERPSHYKKSLINQLEKSWSEIDKNYPKEATRLWVDMVYKDKLKHVYYEYLYDDLVDIFTVYDKGFWNFLMLSVYDFAILEYCSTVSNTTTFENLIIKCHGHKFSNSVEVLVSSQYTVNQ
ncbi:unnamed protein product [Mytilus coruscus]|uniref:G-protein coupled receptors family 1 profile domain-containing protein n=1 Tax=Mytilus coruscus TaxID=42192 RepID=A0A6J8F420_MYTCO|nr:unnamed protein product [Mytilus coruscus]